KLEERDHLAVKHLQNTPSWMVLAKSEVVMVSSTTSAFVRAVVKISATAIGILLLFAGLVRSAELDRFEVANSPIAEGQPWFFGSHSNSLAEPHWVFAMSCDLPQARG